MKKFFVFFAGIFSAVCLFAGEPVSRLPAMRVVAPEDIFLGYEHETVFRDGKPPLLKIVAIKVIRVKPGSEAEKLGIKAGMELLKWNGVQVRNREAGALFSEIKQNLDPTAWTFTFAGSWGGAKTIKLPIHPMISDEKGGVVASIGP